MKGEKQDWLRIDGNMAAFLAELGSGWTMTADPDDYSVVVDAEAKAVLESTRSFSQGLGRHASNTWVKTLNNLLKGSTKKGKKTAEERMAKSSRISLTGIKDHYSDKRAEVEAALQASKTKGAAALAATAEVLHNDEVRDKEVLRTQSVLKEAQAVRDAKIKDLQAKEVRTLKMKHEEYDRKNTEQVAKRVVRETAARKQLEIEAQKDKAKRAEESRCAASAVGGEDGAGSGGGMGGDAEAADAEGAAELEQATVAGQLAQDQLSALEALDRMFQ